MSHTTVTCMLAKIDFGGIAAHAPRCAHREEIGMERRAVGVFCALLVAILASLPSMASAAGSHIQANLTIGSPSIDPGNCDPATQLPYPGDAVCIGTESWTGTFTGVVAGTSLLELAFTAFADGHYVYTGYQDISGTVAGLGSGTFTIQDQGALTVPNPNFILNEGWHVVGGSGTGPLTTLQGGGTASGACDFTSCSVTYRGSLHTPASN